MAKKKAVFDIDAIHKLIDDMVARDSDELDRMANEMYEEGYKEITGEDAPPPTVSEK